MLICSEDGWCWCFSLMTAVMLVCHLLLIADLSCTRSVSQESQADCVFWPEQNRYVTAVNVTQQMGDTGFHCPCVCTRKLDTVNVHSTAGYIWFGLRIWQKQIGLWLPRTTEDSDDWRSKSNMARPIRILIRNCLVLWSSCAIMCVLCVYSQGEEGPPSLEYIQARDLFPQKELVKEDDALQVSFTRQTDNIHFSPHVLF